MLKHLLLSASAVLLAGAPALACTQISSATVPLTGCIADEWQQMQGSGAQEFVYNTADGNFGLMVITEKEVFNASSFRDAIVQNAINGNGGDASKVQVIGGNNEGTMEVYSTATRRFSGYGHVIPNRDQSKAAAFRSANGAAARAERADAARRRPSPAAPARSRRGRCRSGARGRG